MTLQQIKLLDKDMLTPNEIAEVLGCDPNIIRSQAKEDPSKLGFHVCKAKSRVKIPRLSFIAWVETFTTKHE